MSKKVTIGGDRLGSGNKMQTELHNYARSTHNLSKDFISSAAPGVLYPAYVNVGLNGDTFDIDLDAAAMTIPTTGPLFGTFKLQVDVFTAPIRLYQGILHNNPINIGLKMTQVHFPEISVPAPLQRQSEAQQNGIITQITETALLNYLGLRGIGLAENNAPTTQNAIYMYRNVNALPALAYYDIFKNYYANKQEKNAYVITPETFTLQEQDIYEIATFNFFTNEEYNTYNPGENININDLIYSAEIGLKLSANTQPQPDGIYLTLKSSTSGWTEKHSLQYYQEQNIIRGAMHTDSAIGFIFTQNGRDYISNFQIQYAIITSGESVRAKNEIKLTAFPLENIDRMRMELLSNNTLGRTYKITNTAAYYPYKALVDEYDTNERPLATTANQFIMNGLCVKTYQSDIFNNWVQTDWIDGENGINAITAVDTSAGNFQIDALILAKKIYDVLNRVAISGGTYEDWQEAVYTQNAVRKAETPIWHGGMSDEVVFQQIIQTTPTEQQPLGTMGGKGTLLNHGRKGGKIRIKCVEPCIIMAIVSLTPRIVQTQGNKWYLTDLLTMDDLHKPALDGIGFQELITEQMAWFDARFGVVTGMGDQPMIIRKSAGKIPAWLNYMTDVNEAYGEFANTTQRGYCILARNYEYNNGTIKDLTTYIDPAKYNYAFAYSKRDAQNFWLQIRFQIKARRLMSAKVIPNL